MSTEDKRSHLRAVDDSEDEAAATAFADRLEAAFEAQSKAPNAPSNINIDVSDYPADKIVDMAVWILRARKLHAEPVPYKCAGGRAGSVWVSRR